MDRTCSTNVRRTKWIQNFSRKTSREETIWKT